jgi:hypothetical protein
MWVWRNDANKVNVPVLIIEGDGEKLVVEAAIRWAQHLPDSRVVQVPRPYLFPWAGSARAFTIAAETFLHGSFPRTSVKPPRWMAEAGTAR